MRMRAFLLVIVVLLCDPWAHGWGDKGHRIHGELAWKLLDAATREKMKDLLGAETLASLSTWADEIKAARPETRPWHYVNIDPTASRYDATRDCKDGACVVSRLEEWIVVLGDPKREVDQRLEALKWVIHLMGDLHQPLHVALEADRGGNTIEVTFFGEKTNLHRLWDVDLLERFGSTAEVYAAELHADAREDDVALWKVGAPSDWANESFALARSVAYVDVDGRRIENGAVLGREYWLTRASIADRQLKKAAVRLALVLERAFENG